MSMVVCRRCDLYIDTDYDVEGEFIDTYYLCRNCVEELSESEAEARLAEGHPMQHFYNELWKMSG